VEELVCGDDCRDCSLNHDDRCTSRADVPWVRIAEVMDKPSLVFDARGLVDVSPMEEIGFKVEVISKVGSRSPLYGQCLSMRLVGLCRANKVLGYNNL
jgi:hypothetical protein